MPNGNNEVREKRASIIDAQDELIRIRNTTRFLREAFAGLSLREAELSVDGIEGLIVIFDDLEDRVKKVDAVLDGVRTNPS